MGNKQLRLNYQNDINSMTLSQLKKLIQEKNQFENSFIDELKNDPRKGTTNLAEKCIKKNQKLKKEKERIKSLKEIESDLHQKGYQHIAGVDEAGKGALAGPVTAGAVILPEDLNLLEVNDSKKLTVKKRENLYNKIIKKALTVGIGMVSVEEINEMGIATANRLAMKKSLEHLTLTPDFVLIDSVEIKDPGFLHKSIPQGDCRCYSIAAASIVAKVTRDRLMIKLNQKYSEYGFDEHKGYGTEKHRKAVENLGYSEIHRRKFKFQNLKKQTLTNL